MSRVDAARHAQSNWITVCDAIAPLFAHAKIWKRLLRTGAFKNAAKEYASGMYTRHAEANVYLQLYHNLYVWTQFAIG